MAAGRVNAGPSDRCTMEISLTDYLGTSGDDHIAGTDLVDSFDLSQGGDDTARGAGGNDTFYMGGAFTSEDRIFGGSGNDLMALDGDYSAGTLSLSAASEIERVAFEAGHDYDVRLKGGAPDFLVEFQSHIGADDHLMLDGRGSVGMFYESSGTGHETVLGSASFDDFFMGGGLDAADRIDGGQDDNDVMYLNGDYSAGVTMTKHTLQNVEFVRLSQGHDYDLTFAKTTVDDAGMAIDGGDLTHADSLRIDASKAYLGGVTLNAGGGRDVLIGGHGDDSLSGGKGIDRLIGGAGADVLSGGTGVDRFVLLHMTDSTVAAHDLITDFDPFADLDRIALKHIDADTTQAGNQAFHLVAALDGHAGELAQSYDASSNLTSIVGDVDGDGVADLMITVTGDHTDSAGFVL